MKPDFRNPNVVATLGIMTALVAALTSFHPWPTTPAGGYIHLGDIAIYFVAIAMGPWAGLVAGGLGAALADVLSGFAIFAPISLVAHGLQGFVAGWLTRDSRAMGRMVAGVAAGSVVLIAGFFIGEVILYSANPTIFSPEGLGDTPVAIAYAEVPWNIVQELVGSLGIAVYVAVSRAYPRLAETGE